MATTSFDTRATNHDIAIDLAADAWAKACRVSGRIIRTPSTVVPLKPQRPGRKSGVYRLEAADCMEDPVIAKRCLRDSATIERQIYERVLPAIELSALRFHGFVEDDEPAYCWLFVEDAGTVKLTESDRGLAAQWLARLHTLTAAMVDTVSLPERGASHYHEHSRGNGES